MSDRARQRIIDAHHHVWDLTRNTHPWLADQPVQFRYGPYDALKRNYLPADFLADCAPFNLAGSIYVEAEWDPRDPQGEVDWISEQAAATGIPSAVVAQAWLHQHTAEALLSRYGAHPLVRGVRHKPAASPAPNTAPPDHPAALHRAEFRRGFQALAHHGLSFDLQVPFWHLRDARALADAAPDVPIALNHTGLPADRTAEGLTAWRAALTHFAGAPQTAIKISGLGVPGTPWSVEANREVVLNAIDIFGPARVMFASNFPVDSLIASYTTIYDGFFSILTPFSAEERDAMLYANAKRFYRIDNEAIL